ncbi:MAG: Mut7-C ubiquitin/RNAse domain-containing protein [Gammaproteobacteria bacterium]|nr:Mut7-C ubiquitin/RNAse domain-containing protein [Gammaproteobacteria bacterium]
MALFIFMNVSYFRFYEKLNDFLSVNQRKKTVQYPFKGSPAIKDPIEAQGVPHTEVDLIVVNGESVDFKYRLQHGDRVSVYPIFENFDITSIVKLREQPLRRIAFLLDVNLGKLARRLRMLGFDASYKNNYTDVDLVRITVAEKRVLLTRDRRLLFHKSIIHGYWVRATEPDVQVTEVMCRFDLHSMIRPFHRCLECNGLIAPVAKQDIIDRLLPLTTKYYDKFYRCVNCDKIYWQGSHMQHMTQTVDAIVRKQS